MTGYRYDDVVKPLIGISCCTKAFGIHGMVNHAASDTYFRAVDRRWCMDPSTGSRDPDPHGSASDGNRLGGADHAVEHLDSNWGKTPGRPVFQAG